MSFLAPLFLFGVLAISLPILFHLIRNTTRERTVFSSLLFLMPTPPRLTRRSRFEHLLLLLLRCLALALLAFGFARPFLKKPVTASPVSGQARRLVILVDTSASMRRPDLWAGARQKAESVIRQATPADQVALFAFDREVRTLLTFQQWNAAPASERSTLALSRLAELSPGWSATRLGNALIQAAEALADTEGKTVLGPARIVLISDMQEGAHLEPLQGYEWPKGVELSVESVKPRHPGNAALQLAGGRDETGPQAAPRLRLRVSNAADSSSSQFRVGWSKAGNSLLGPAEEIYVPPGQSRIVTAPTPSAPESMNRLILQGDSQEFDNVVFAIPPQTNRLNVLYFGADSETNPRQPLYFLQRAFQETPRQSVQVLVRPPSAPLVEAEAQAALLYVVADVLPGPLISSLRDKLKAGKTILFPLKTEAAASTLAGLLGLDKLEAQEARSQAYALLANIDFRHPLFAPFADPRFSDFTKIHFWGHRQIQAAAIPGARVLASFDNNDPAILEVPAGQGRLLVLTFSWHPDDSQFALSTKFVPWLYSVLEQSGAASPPPSQYHVGDVVPLLPLMGLSSPGSSLSFLVHLPDGTSVTTPAGVTNFTQTSLPGIYSVTFSASPGPATPTPASHAFAVNLDPGEGRTAPVALDELEKLGAPLARLAPSPERQAERQAWLRNSELEGRQKLWRWLVLAALAVLLFETWLAGRTARQMGAEQLF